MIPSTFLPPLPRPRIGEENKLPLPASELLAHIAILRELYIPPVHGGFLPDDSFDDDDDDGDDQVDSHKDVRVNKKATVGQIAAGINGLGLGFGMVDDLSGDQTPDGSGMNTPVPIARDSDDDDSASGSGSGSESEEESRPHLDPFEREWAEKWLGGLVRRSQGYLESQEEVEVDERKHENVREVEAVLRDSTAVLAMMAGTSAAGSLTRHLVFPIADSLAPALKLLRSNAEPNPALSPQTNTFLASLSTSPTSPKTLRRPSISASVSGKAKTRRQSESLSTHSVSPTTTATDTSTSTSPHRHRHKHQRKKKAAIPILLHDAPMGDHLGVGMQTWGSAILLGRRMALRPEDFGLFPPASSGSGSSANAIAKRGVRVLELGAGTGLLSILCRKLLDLHHASTSSTSTSTSKGRSEDSGSGLGLVVATDFLPNVLDNLKICVDLNFPPHLAQSGQIDTSTDINRQEGIHIAKLDWTTFPTYMAGMTGGVNDEGDKEELAPFVTPAHTEAEGESPESRAFDLVLASDCVYDETHAKLLRQVTSWVLRLPDPNDKDDIGGTFHILSPLRPTFGPELESTDIHFPNLSTYLPVEQRSAAAAAAAAGTSSGSIDEDLRGEGLGIARGLKLGTRGTGKKSVEHRRGEGRVDENGGYWWWQVGWG